MTSDPDANARRIFSRLCSLERSAWDGLLARECGSDEDLRRRVISLVAHDQAAEIEGLLEGPVPGGSGLFDADAGGTTREDGVRSRSGLEEGARLGEFRIVREVGRGGMGVVYEAEQIPLGRVVALKVLEPHPLLAPRSIERFLREAEVVARLRHPGIVEIHTVGEEAGTYYFAMPLIEGAPLDRVLARLATRSVEQLSAGMLREAIESERYRSPGDDGPGGGAGETQGPDSDSGRQGSEAYVGQICGIVAEVADALQCAHGKGVIHRDVKPSNILVKANGATVLTDFGLARPVDAATLTRSGEFAGTPAYVSPEQAQGRSLDHRTDIFSLGVTLYELITLRRPFEAETTAALMARIVSRDPPMPRRVNPQIPRDLETICLTALEKDSARRYASAGEMAADLRRFLAYQPVKARPVGRLTRSWRWTRRNPARAVAIILPLVLVLGGSLAFGFYQIGVNEQIRLAQKQTRHEAEQTRMASARALASRAGMAAQRGLWEEALQGYDQALASGYSDEVELRLAMVEAWQGQFDDERALETLDELARREDLGRHQAKVLLLQGLSRMHLSADSAAGSGLIESAVKLGGLAPADEFLARASLARTVGEQKRLLEQALRADPYHHAAHVALAHLLVLLGEFDRVRELVVSFEAKYPDDPVALFLRGVCRSIDPMGGEEAESIIERLDRHGWTRPAANLTVWREVYRQARAIEKDGARFGAELFVEGVKPETHVTYVLSLAPRLLKLVGLALRLGGKDSAARGPNMLTAFPPRVTEVLREAGQQLVSDLVLKSGPRLLERAETLMSEVIEVYPVGIGYLLRGMLRMEGAKLAEAERDFLAAYGSPSPAPLRRMPLVLAITVQWAQTGDSLRAAGEHKAARIRTARTIERLMALPDPSRPERRFMATVALSIGELDLAGEIVARWRRLFPEDVQGLLMQAAIHLVRGGRGLALREAGEVLEREPENPDAQRIRQAAMKGLRDDTRPPPQSGGDGIHQEL